VVFLKKLLPLVAGLLVCLGLAGAFFGFGPGLVSREFQDGWRFNTGQLPPHAWIGQTFTSRLDGLARIDVLLGSFGLPLVKPLTLELTAVDRPRQDHLARPRPLVDQGVTIPLHGPLQIGQTFLPRRDGLSGVRVLLDAGSMPAPASVRFRLWEAGVIDLPGELLREVVVPAADLPAWGFFEFAFRPLEGSAGRPLLFTLDLAGVPRHTWRDKTFQGLLLRFISDQGQPDGQPWQGVNPEGSAWRPEISVGKDYSFNEPLTLWPANRHLKWRYWQGDLAFGLAYPPALEPGPVLRRAGRRGLAISDNSFNSFSFKPLEDSKGRSFLFSLKTTPGPGREPVALADWALRYPGGCLVVDGVPYEGGLAFRAYNAAAKGTVWRELRDKVTRNKPAPWSGPWFIAALAAAHLLLVGLLVGLVWPRA